MLILYIVGGIISVIVLALLVFGIYSRIVDWKRGWRVGENPRGAEIGNYNYTGLYEYRTTNGWIKESGQLTKGKKTGLWKNYYYGRDGYPGYWEHNNYKNGLKEGLCKSFYAGKEGLLLQEINFFKEDKREGPYKYYFKNGQLSQKGNYKEGFQDGLWVDYHENGNLNCEGSYKPNGERNWNPNIGIKHGLWKWYYENGQLESEGEYKNGLKDGNWEFYWDNGKIQSEGSFKNDLREGNWKMYFENGQFHKQGEYEHYKDDSFEHSIVLKHRKVGYWKIYQENGSLHEQGEYKNGLKDGNWEFYWDNGKIQSEGSFKNDLREGNWKMYFENGELKSVYNYHKGKSEELEAASKEVMDKFMESIGGKDGLRKSTEIFSNYKTNPTENFNCLELIELKRPEKVDYNSGPLGLGGIDVKALSEIDTYDHRISSGEQVPQTLVDTFICDVAKICNKKSKILISDVLKAFDVYLKQPFNEIPGYRPRAHSKFIDQIFKSEQLEILANQVVDYIDKYGIRDIK